MAYQDISRGVRLAADHAKYILWLQKDTEARQAAYAAVTTAGNKVKTERASGVIIPFDTSGINLVYLPAKLISATQSGRGAELAKTLEQILREYCFTDTQVEGLTTPNIIEGAHKFKFAKLTVVQRVTTATTKSSSRITSRQYYKHENDSVTGHFGKKIASNTYDTVVTAIKADTKFISLFAGSANALASRYRFVPEGA